MGIEVYIYIIIVIVIIIIIVIVIIIIIMYITHQMSSDVTFLIMLYGQESQKVYGPP